jgi:hypothetical protein
MKPWYLDPVKTCAVLNRISKRFTFQQLVELKAAMDYYTMKLWSKQEAFYARQNIIQYVDIQQYDV